MKFRSRHLVMLILLVSAAHLAEGTELTSGAFELRGRYMSELLTRLAPAAQAGTIAAAAERMNRTGAIDLPVASLLSTRVVWTMRQPAAQAVAMEYATGRAADARLFSQQV